MDALFSKFSLQTFLRQFFCGVVFFVPICSAAMQIGKICHIDKWGSGSFLLVASLAAIIGTIIYHLEKNLHSYPLQLAYEYYYQRKRAWWACLLFLLLIFAPIICLVIVCYGLAVKYMLLIATALYVMLAFVLLRTGWSRIVEPTMQSWCLEEFSIHQRSDEVLGIKDVEILCRNSVAKRLSTWSDFIHCVQSCCFAWILGCCVVKLDYFKGASIVDKIPLTVVGCVLLLVLEMFIDMHRYRFVQAVKNVKRIVILSDVFTSSIFPAFKVHSGANVITCRIETNKRDNSIQVHRCRLLIQVEKLRSLGSKSLLFDCLIDGVRYVWHAPADELLACFEKFNFHKSNNPDTLFELYLDYKQGGVYDLSWASDSEPIYRLSPVLNGDEYRHFFNHSNLFTIL